MSPSIFSCLLGSALGLLGSSSLASMLATCPPSSAASSALEDTPARVSVTPRPTTVLG
jgi:hypothetical protein